MMVYRWGNNSKRSTMKGRECRVLARGKMNSILIEFTDNGQKEIVSRRSIGNITKEPYKQLKLF